MINDYQALEEYQRKRKGIVFPPIIISSLVTTLGFVALSLGAQLCNKQMLIVMVLEVLCAFIAFVWTTAVLIIMLGEPKEPEEIKNSQDSSG
jgi:predicted RND superfamily exporter protein